MDRIIPHTSRWRQFTVKNVSQRTVETVVERLRTASAPRLRNFEMIFEAIDSFGITNVTSNVRDHDHLFTGGAASLTEARLMGRHIYAPPLTGLTYLHLGGSHQATKITANGLRDLLTASPFLTDLALEHLDILFPLVSDIQIPSLRSLTMNFSCSTPNFRKLFSLLSLPKLETLLLAHVSQFDEQFIDFGTQSYATATALKLMKCRCINHSLAKSLYSSFPSIIHLDLIGSSGLVLEQPHVRGDSDGAIIWPRLKTITISCPMRYEMIFDFIYNRIKLGHPLVTVNVWSRIRQETAVFIVDDESKRDSLCFEVKSAIEEVSFEEGKYEDFLGDF